MRAGFYLACLDFSLRVLALRSLKSPRLPRFSHDHIIAEHWFFYSVIINFYYHTRVFKRDLLKDFYWNIQGVRWRIRLIVQITIVKWNINTNLKENKYKLKLSVTARVSHKMELKWFILLNTAKSTIPIVETADIWMKTSILVYVITEKLTFDHTGLEGNQRTNNRLPHCCNQPSAPSDSPPPLQWTSCILARRAVKYFEGLFRICIYRRPPDHFEGLG